MLTQHTLHYALPVSQHVHRQNIIARIYKGCKTCMNMNSYAILRDLLQRVSCAGSDRRRYAAALFTKTMFLQCKWASSQELFSVLIVRFVTTLPLSIDLNVTYKILLMQLCAVLKNEQSAWLGAILVTRGLIFISSLKNWYCVWNLAPSRSSFWRAFYFVRVRHRRACFTSSGLCWWRLPGERGGARCNAVIMKRGPLPLQLETS